MATSIHLHTEVKINGKWHHYGNPAVGYKYRMFAKMCGVRLTDDLDITPINEPRGLPDDITEITKFDHSILGNDAHSQSWLNANEILLLEEFVTNLNEEDLKKAAEESEQKLKHSSENLGGMIFTITQPSWYPEMIWGYLFGNSWGGFTKYPEYNPEGLEDIRFVFWFDC
jgi:hypothetical protein